MMSEKFVMSWRNVSKCEAKTFATGFLVACSNGELASQSIE